MSSVRPPAVAGTFYPADPGELDNVVGRMLNEAPAGGQPAPKALIVPHAGYVYSGPVAAGAYNRLMAARDRITRVVLLGPSHRVPLSGLATSGADFFRSPLGNIPLDRAAIERIEALHQVRRVDAAHQMEHSLEVQLPFLQAVLERFALVPLVVGEARAAETAEVLAMLWGGEETVIVVSSDLSHYHDYLTAQRLDQETSRAIEALNPAAIGHEGACGRRPIEGLLTVAREKGLTAETLELRNSGDTAGPRDRVVGYGAWAFS